MRDGLQAAMTTCTDSKRTLAAYTKHIQSFGETTSQLHHDNWCMDIELRSVDKTMS